ncbi:MAG: hypothetical protein E7331_04235 [Clostridiales bacterium]|nr:hypothetical protein [Clostridiales bacterium]
MAKKNPWWDKVLSFNRKRRAQDEKADDFEALMRALPPGQVKNLMKDEVCGAIMRKYGFGE